MAKPDIYHQMQQALTFSHRAPVAGPSKQPPKKHWSLTLPPHTNLSSGGFIHLKYFQAGVQVVRSVANQRLYVLKVVRRFVDACDEEIPSRDDEEDVFKYDVPPELRVSTCPEAIVRLSDEDYFPKLVMWQQRSATHWGLFSQYYNGGNLKQFIRKHFDYLDEETGQISRRSIPEHFIWHVAEQLGEALVYLHLGRPHGTSGPGACSPLPGWTPVYHRDISDSNILLHYPPAGGSQLQKYKSQAFPQVVLGDFGEAAIQGDDPVKLQGGVPPASSIHPDLKAWTDVHQFGCVLRLLCMAHVDLDEYSDTDQAHDTEDDTESWERDRPDSQTLAYCNDYGAEGIYSQELIWLLQAFERPNMEETSIVEQPDVVPPIAWVAGTLLPQARGRVWLLSQPEVPTEAYYKNLDVSWTKPEDLQPEPDDGGKIKRVHGLDTEDGGLDEDCPRSKVQKLLDFRPVARKSKPE